MKFHSALWISAAAAAVVVAALAQTSQSSRWVAVASQHRASYASASATPASSGDLSLNRAANRITVQGSGAQLTVEAGPKDNMMAFKVDGLNNPEIVVHRGARITFIVVNVDDDMAHNFALTRTAPPYALRVSAADELAHTPVLRAHSDEKAPLAAQVLVVEAAGAGTGYYLCAVPGHAKAGMFGKLVIEP